MEIVNGLVEKIQHRHTPCKFIEDFACEAKNIFSCFPFVPIFHCFSFYIFSVFFFSFLLFFLFLSFSFFFSHFLFFSRPMVRFLVHKSVSLVLSSVHILLSASLFSWHRFDELCGHPIRQNSLLSIFLVLSQCTHSS